MRGGVGGQKGARGDDVGADRFGELGERVVARFVAQLVQQFHGDESTVAPFHTEGGGPFEAVHFEQDAGAVVDGRAPAQARDADERRAARPCTRTTKMPIAAGRGCGKRRLRVRKPSSRPGALAPSARPSLAPWIDVAADAVGAAEQGLGALHVAVGERGAHRRARDAQAVHLVAHHPGDVEAARLAGAVEHRVVAGAARAEAEVVADQHIARAEPGDQHVVDERGRRLRGERSVEAADDDLLDAAARELGELVAQRRDAGRRRLGLAGSAAK